MQHHKTDIIKFITSTVYIMLNPNMSIYNLQTPKNRLISYKAEANADCDISDGSSVKKGTVIDVIEKD